MSDSSWSRWRNQYGGVKATEAKRLRELGSEYDRPKRLLAQAELDKAMLKELAELGLLTPERRRQAVAMLVDRFGAFERRRGRVVGQHRSTAPHAPPTS